MRKSPRLGEEGSESDAFFISWSDLLALLLVLFAYIISISTIDAFKLDKATQSFKEGLGGAREEYVTQDEFVVLKEELEKMVKEKELGQEIQITNTSTGLKLDLGHKSVFESGSADLKNQADQILGILATELKKRAVTILIEGHTDDVPIQSEEFPSNWHLSSIRAAEVLYYLSNNGVDPSNFTLVGYADTKPLVPNTSSENRQKNRRVSIFIEPKRSVHKNPDSIDFKRR